MKTDWAEQNLQVIRTLMERSAIYQRALGPIMWWAGTVAVVSAGIGGVSLRRSEGGWSFFLHWLVTGAVVMAGAFWLARRQARREHEAFWSPSARRVAQAIVPPLLVALMLTGLVWEFGDAFDDAMVGLWAMLYGCALHTAGFFAPRGLRVLGWLFLASGLAWWMVMMNFSWGQTGWLIHLAMGIIFGGLHLGYAFYLTVIKREP